MQSTLVKTMRPNVSRRRVGGACGWPTPFCGTPAKVEAMAAWCGSSHAEVLDERRVFAVGLCAGKLLNGDIADARGHLLASPLARGGRGEVRFVSHYPAREIGHGRHMRLEVDSAAARGSRSQKPDARCREEGGEEQSPPVLPEPVAEEKNRYGEAQRETADEQQIDQPLGPDQAWDGGSPDFGRETFQQDLAIGLGRELGHSDLGGNVLAFQGQLAQEGGAQAVEGALSETACRVGLRDLAHDQLDQVARRGSLYYLGVFEADIKGFLDLHHNFNGVQAHDPFRQSRLVTPSVSLEVAGVDSSCWRFGRRGDLWPARVFA